VYTLSDALSRNFEKHISTYGSHLNFVLMRVRECKMNKMKKLSGVLHKRPRKMHADVNYFQL